MGLTHLDILNFYKKFFNQQITNVADIFIAENYIQHNPGVQQGRQALKDAFNKRFSIEEHFELAIDRVLIGQNYVAVFVRNINEHGKTKFSVIDLYRVEGNQLVEHWDYFDYKNIYNQ